MRYSIMIFSFLILTLSIFGISYAANKVTVIPLHTVEQSPASPTVSTVFFYGFNSTGTFATQIRYAGIAGQGAGSSEDGHFFPMTRNCTVTNFTLYITGKSNMAGDSVTITLQKNGSDTSISKVFIDGNSADNTVYTVSGSESYSAGDTFSIPVVATSNADGQINFTGSFDIVY